jgi:hypothetical protein
MQVFLAASLSQHPASECCAYFAHGELSTVRGSQAWVL